MRRTEDMTVTTRVLWRFIALLFYFLSGILVYPVTKKTEKMRRKCAAITQNWSISDRENSIIKKPLSVSCEKFFYFIHMFLIYLDSDLSLYLLIGIKSRIFLWNCPIQKPINFNLQFEKCWEKVGIRINSNFVNPNLNFIAKVKPLLADTCSGWALSEAPRVNIWNKTVLVDSGSNFCKRESFSLS